MNKYFLKLKNNANDSQVISSGHDQMTKLSTAQGFMSDSLYKYRKELSEYLFFDFSVNNLMV